MIKAMEAQAAGERYLAAMGMLAESGNAKTIVLPADIQESLRGILGRSKE